MSAFHLSGDTIFLEKAKDLGQRLLGAFTSSSGIPYSDVNLKSTRGHAPKWSPDSSMISLHFYFLKLPFIFVCLFVCFVTLFVFCFDFNLQLTETIVIDC